MYALQWPMSEDPTDHTGPTRVVAAMDPQGTDERVMELLKWNFIEHYTKNRTPFGVYLHASWLLAQPSRIRLLNDFFAWATSHENTFFATNAQMLRWMRSPTPASAMRTSEAWTSCGPAAGTGVGPSPQPPSTDCNSESPNYQQCLTSSGGTMRACVSQCPSAVPSLDTAGAVCGDCQCFSPLETPVSCPHDCDSSGPCEAVPQPWDGPPPASVSTPLNGSLGTANATERTIAAEAASAADDAAADAIVVAVSSPSPSAPLAPSPSPSTPGDDNGFQQDQQYGFSPSPSSFTAGMSPSPQPRSSTAATIPAPAPSPDLVTESMAPSSAPLAPAPSLSSPSPSPTSAAQNVTAAATTVENSTDTSVPPSASPPLNHTQASPSPSSVVISGVARSATTDSATENAAVSLSLPSAILLGLLLPMVGVLTTLAVCHCNRKRSSCRSCTSMPRFFAQKDGALIYP